MGARGLIPAPTVSALSGPISLPNLPARRPAAPPAQPELRPAPMTRREARALQETRVLQDSAEAAPATWYSVGGIEVGPSAGSSTAPLTRAQARSQAHARARQLATPTTQPLRTAPPRSRAERRAADRLAAREVTSTGSTAMGRRAALTVAVVGLGVALIHDGASSAVAGGPSTGATTNTAALRLGALTTPGAATAAADPTYRDVLDTYAYHAAARRHRRAAASPSASLTADAAASPTPDASATPDGSAPGSLSASPSVARVLASGVGSVAQRMYGTPRSGLPWFSGWWVGGDKTSSSMAQAQSWRGSLMDFATAYPQYSSWADMSNSAWSISVWKGYGGRLAYGLPLLPQDRRGQWDDVISGAHDDVFRTIAQQMIDNGFADSAIRVGLEANGDWFPWGANASSAAQFKAAFRHVVGVMRAVDPKLTFWFDTSASANPLPGTSGRGAVMLNTLYPGDDVVDGISMDHYDFYSLVAKTDQAFKDAMSPPNGTGLQDAVDFARAHGKGFAVPEWGLHGVQGPGDNPFFMQKMFDFFQANKDVLVYENYFDEPADYIHNSLMSGQDPQSAAVYRKLWAGK